MCKFASCGENLTRSVTLFGRFTHIKIKDMAFMPSGNPRESDCPYRGSEVG